MPLFMVQCIHTAYPVTEWLCQGSRQNQLDFAPLIFQDLLQFCILKSGSRYACTKYYDSIYHFSLLILHLPCRGFANG